MHCYAALNSPFLLGRLYIQINCALKPPYMHHIICIFHLVVAHIKHMLNCSRMYSVTIYFGYKEYFSLLNSPPPGRHLLGECRHYISLQLLATIECMAASKVISTLPKVYPFEIRGNLFSSLTNTIKKTTLQVYYFLQFFQD